MAPGQVRARALEVPAPEVARAAEVPALEVEVAAAAEVPALHPVASNKSSLAMLDERCSAARGSAAARVWARDEEPAKGSRAPQALEPVG